MFKKILIAFDGSEASKRALDHAADMAYEAKGNLIILTVIPKITLPIFSDEGFGSAPSASARDFGEYQDRMKDTYTRALSEATNDTQKKFPDLSITSIIYEERPSVAIVEEAEKQEVNLIVMGSRGLGGISGWILGSTSRRVVESCTKPILIIK